MCSWVGPEKRPTLTRYRRDKLRKNIVVIFDIWKKLPKHTQVFRCKYHDNIRTVDLVTLVQSPMVTLTKDEVDVHIL